MDELTVEFPPETSKADVEALQADLERLDAVSDAIPLEARGLNPQSVALWIQIVKDTVGAVGSAVVILKTIIDLIRERGVKNVVVKLANGAEIKVDDTSAGEAERLIQAVGKPTEPH